jgi:hypothetical protein
MSLFTTPENQIPPPAFPLTARINQAITDFYFDRFASKYLSDYEVRKTSGLREADHNEEVGGASNSAHLHGLAVDFQLWKNGQRVSPSEEAKVFAQVVKPAWPGYAQNEPEKNHIHVNLSRQITISTGLTSLAVFGFIAVPVVKKLLKPERKRR